MIAAKDDKLKTPIGHDFPMMNDTWPGQIDKSGPYFYTASSHMNGNSLPGDRLL
jgi:hypothetical protein